MAKFRRREQTKYDLQKHMADIKNLEDFSFEFSPTGDYRTITINGYKGDSKKVIIPAASSGGTPVTAIDHQKDADIFGLKDLFSVEDRSFAKCTGLTSITLPKSVVHIDDDVFSGCSDLTEIIVDEQNPVFASDDGVLFDKNKTTLIKYPEGRKGEYTIPDSVIEIISDAFEGFSGRLVYRD